jgi:hypothetical protein
VPKVGSKKFAYTPSGEKAAKTYAKKTGKTMTVAKSPGPQPFPPYKGKGK